MTGRSVSACDGARARRELVHVAESLEDEAVHPALEQAPHLAGEAADRFLDRRSSPNGSIRMPSGPMAPTTAARPPAASRARRDRRAVDRLGLIGETVARQLERVGAEGVGLEDLGAGLDVRSVDLAAPGRAGGGSARRSRR